MMIRKAQLSDCACVGEIGVQAIVKSPYGQHTGLNIKPELQRKRKEAARDYCEEHLPWVFVAVEAAMSG